MEAVGGVSCTNDILGNRLTKGSNTYTWDILNRMLSFGQTEYRYRADGMRVQKISGSNATRYRYDGQMGIEDVAGSMVTRYGLGARGVDFIEQSTGTGSSVVFPVYDAHGNNVASLSRDGVGYQISNRRSFDAWGNVRLGVPTGDPTGCYCVNLGHKQDDESGLVYMRARYYEPTTGRFVSQDTAMDGANWFIYCGNNPVGRIDRDGQFDESSADAAYVLLWMAVFGYIEASATACSISKMAQKLNITCNLLLAAYFLSPDHEIGRTLGDAFANANRAFVGAAVSTFGIYCFSEPKFNSIAAEAVGFFYQYSAFIGVFLALNEFEGSLQ